MNVSSILDNTIAFFSPRWGAERIAIRHQLARIQDTNGVHESMRKLMSGRQGGYEAGKTDRLKGRTGGSPHENDVPRAQVDMLRWRSWNLYRNCPQARKICRSIGAKVIGPGLAPQSQATSPDGTPFVDFRKRASEIWDEFTKECDFRGKPGSGGQNFSVMSKTALRATMLSGGVLSRFHHLSPSEQRKRGLLVPLQVQLIHADRLDETKHGEDLFYGFKLDSEGRVLGAWIIKGGITNGTTIDRESVYVPASEFRHLMAEEDIDQLIGVPWFGAALLTMTDVQEYEYNELTAARISSCVAFGYRRSGGKSGGIGLPYGEGGDTDITDADGNPITHMQPGMVFDLGQSGELDMVNPQRPNAGASEFISHLIRSEAVSMPGVKGSTLSADYRNSSFSSERSADIDIWPEIEEIQDWFSVGFCQPVYDECITAAVIAGLFAGVAGFSAADFIARKREYLKTNWQGPVPRSINPKDDADASRVRVQSGISSPQREAAQVGRDWREILQEIDEFIDYATELGLPEDIWQQSLGIEQKDEQPAAESATSEPATKKEPSDAVNQALLGDLRSDVFDLGDQIDELLEKSNGQPPLQVVLPPPPTQNFTINTPEQQVTVNTPAADPPNVVVNVPKQAAPQVNVTVPPADPPAEYDIEPVRDSKTGRVTRFNRVPKGG
jgi:lambda family phage portal protein